MFTKLHIKNYKSVLNNEMELGRVNVLIGENGCGKSNLLEAVAFLSAAKENKLDPDSLYAKGIRLMPAELTKSSFEDIDEEDKVDGEKIELMLASADGEIRASMESDTYENKEVWIDGEESADVATILADYLAAYLGFSGTEKFEQLKKKKKYSKENIDKLIALGPESHDPAIRNKFYAEHESFKKLHAPIKPFCIYHANIKALKGFFIESRKLPVGINGESLDSFLAGLTDEEKEQVETYMYLIDWYKDHIIDHDKSLKMKGLNKGRANTSLYFKDRFMEEGRNIISADSANEGVLHILFYLGLFISKQTPSFFAIDNIENSLNPHLCRELMRVICELAKKNNKQTIITTHNPAILDGLNLHDDEIRLFEVSRNPDGHTKTRRIKVKPEVDGKKYKLSELWMRGYLGAISKNF